MVRICLALLALHLIVPAHAQQAGTADVAPRLALLVANTTYAGTDPLPQLGNDAAALAEQLRQDGFDTEIKQNLSKLALQAALTAFRAKIKPGATVLIYFGGYGIRAGRQNHFIPIGAQIWAEPDVVRDGVSIESVLADLNASGARTKLAVLDVSRRNPFERNFRQFSAGLGSVGTPLNTLIISAAGQNQVINDTPGEQSVFMRELLNEMRVPDVTADVVFNKTRLAVSIATKSEEVPWVSSSLTEEFYFRRAPAADNRPAARVREEVRAEPRAEDARRDPVRTENARREPPRREASLPPASAACADQVSMAEAMGFADLQIVSPCRKGASVSINAGQISLQANFDAEGKTRLRIPLFEETTKLTWTSGDGTIKTETVRFPDIGGALRIALVWRQPIDLQLHVVEPGSSVSSTSGHVSRRNSNGDFRAGIGSLQVDAGAASGVERIEVYDVAPQRNPRSGLFKVYVDFTARGDTPEPPYCGAGESAAPSFEIVVLRYGQLGKPRRFGFRAEPCGVPLQTRRPSYFADVSAAP